MSGPERKLPPYYGWVVVGSEGFVSPDGDVAWEPTVKVTANEDGPDGKTYVRDIAWFQPDDYGFELARKFCEAMDLTYRESLERYA